MGFKKKHWLFHLLALIVIVILVRTNCNHDTVIKKPPVTKAVCTLPKIIKVYPSDCVNDQTDNDDAIDAGSGADDETDKAGTLDVARPCENAEDCGCGYDCVGEQCRKLEKSCCANADCKVGDFCHKNENEQSGVCLQSQCETSDECGACGTHCINHICVSTNCCADADCPTGNACIFIYSWNARMGVCITPECIHDADCGCGQTCSRHYCTLYSQDGSPIHCCKDDFFYNGTCRSREYIQDGHCFEDEHCPAGKVCYDNTCLPATCMENADCGCEAVCRKGHCESGCDYDSDCCNQGDICDRGSCIDPTEEEDE